MANTSILNQSYWAAAAFVPDLPPLRIVKSESILDRLARLMTKTMGVSIRFTSQSLFEDETRKVKLLRIAVLRLGSNDRNGEATRCPAGMPHRQRALTRKGDSVASAATFKMLGH